RGADMVADNQLVFDEALARNPRLMLKGRTPRAVGLAEMVESNMLTNTGEVLGYLKPLIRRDLLRTHGVGYDESLPIGEDYDFLVRLQASGASLWVTPDPLYFYRRYPGSTSHRWSLDHLAQMERGDAAFRADFPPSEPQVARAMERREASVRHAAGGLRAV